MPSNFSPIYHPLFLEAARGVLRESPTDSLADALALLSAFAANCQPQQPELPKGLVADLWALQHTGRARPALRVVTPPLVLVDVTDRGRLARLKMEWIEGDGCSGILYPHRDMAGRMDDEGKNGGIFTDAAWDGARMAALGHAEANGFGIPGNADVCWSVELVNEADADALQSVFTATANPWKPRAALHGRSAGAAFLVGLVYLGLRAREGAPIEAEMRRKVITLLPLLVLPALPEHGTLQALGATERQKLEALKHHLANLTIVFPESHGEGAAAGAMLVPDVASLVACVVTRLAAESVPDTIPRTLRATHYVGGGKVEALAKSLRKPGAVVVHGPAGIGKSALVFETVRRLVESEGAFPGGRLYINLYNPFTDADSMRRAMLEDIVRPLGETPFEEWPKLAVQARNLLARSRVLIVIEGAENVPESGIADVLEPLGGNTHVVWLTRRSTDSVAEGLAGSPAHEVLPLSREDSRELLCHHANLDPATLDDASCAALDSIAHDAGFTPQFLVWAGRAIRHDDSATPQLIAEEIHADLLGEIADPDDRRNTNARCFLERSLARIKHTEDYPTLDASARQLFAALCAFHPVHGAPAALWPLSAGLDAAKRAQQREFSKARRELLSLRLARLDNEENAHPVHALAGTLATALWREQPAEMRSAALGALALAAMQHLAAPRPVDWSRNAPWLATTAAFARHWEQWSTAAGFDAGSKIARDHCDTWVEFMRSDVAQQHCLPLKDAAWSAIRAHFEALVRVHPDMPGYQHGLSVAWDNLGDVHRARHDWTGAEQAYAEAKKILEALVRAHPDMPGYHHGLSVAWRHVGEVHRARRDWTGAEQAYAKAKQILEALVRAHPDMPDYHHGLSVAWDNLGDVHREREDWTGAEQAYAKAKKTLEALAQDYPDVPDYQRDLAVSWRHVGDVHRVHHDWTGAQHAYAEAKKTLEALARTYPDVPSYQRDLAVSWRHEGDVHRARKDWTGAEQAYAEAKKILEALARAYPDVPNYQRDLAAFWRHVGDVHRGRQEWTGAEQAYAEAMKILEALARAYPDVPNYQRDLAAFWGHLGDVHRARQDWTGVEQAYAKAMKIREALARAYPDVPSYQRDLAACWGQVGDVHRGRQDWTGAEHAYAEAKKIREALAQAYPDVPDYQRDLAVSWRHVGDMHSARQDWTGAQHADAEARKIREALARAYPDVPGYQRDLAVSWRHVGDVKESGRNGPVPSRLTRKPRKSAKP